jgi:hypothetical protein
MKEFKHELGIEAKDIVTGFSGIVISRTEHITGCNTYGITPKAIDGKTLDTNWFDENRVEKIGNGVIIEQHNDGAGENHPSSHKSHF